LESDNGVSFANKKAENFFVLNFNQIMSRGKIITTVSLVILGGTSVASLIVYLRRRQRRQLRPPSTNTDPFVIPPSLLESEYAQELKIAVHLALEAGDRMYPHCDAKGTEEELLHDDLGIQTKGQAENFCTKIDLENERSIIEGLQRAFPNYAVIGEETVGTGALPPISSSSLTWIIDPIDGTTNFASGLPLTCVSIGLTMGRHKPVLGVVYAPMTCELYLAVRNHGAYRNGVRIHVSKQQPKNIHDHNNKTLSDSVVCFEFGYARSSNAIASMVRVVQNILQHGCRTTRSLGSGVLDLCYVATGRLDVVYAGVVNEGWKPWDYAAGVLVATEAGCTVQPIIPQPKSISAPANADVDDTDDAFDLYSESIICAVGTNLLEEIRQLILKK
jgi:fructose-1,6-bisphosphatase/inositol monophosphatase family enzyme